MRENDEVEQFVVDHQDLLARMLAYGGAEAQGYALALLVNGGTIQDIESIQQRLDDLKSEVIE